MNLSHFRPTNTHWDVPFIERLGVEAVCNYINTVYQSLNNMKPGSSFFVVEEVPPDAHDLFVKSACQWMTTDPDFYFSEDYTIIKRKEYDDPSKWIKGTGAKRDLDGDGDFHPSGKPRQSNVVGAGEPAAA